MHAAMRMRAPGDGVQPRLSDTQDVVTHRHIAGDGTLCGGEVRACAHRRGSTAGRASTRQFGARCSAISALSSDASSSSGTSLRWLPW